MPASSRDMNIPVLATLGVVSAILVFVIVVATQAWFRYEFNREYELKVILRPNPELNEQRREQLAQLEGYRMVDPQKQVVAIPIDVAMQKTVTDYEGRTPAK